MSRKTEKLYGSSPHIEKDDSGKAVIKKKEKHTQAEEEGHDGLKSEVDNLHEHRTIHMRHERDLMELHHKHSHEFAVANGDAHAALFAKHEEEHKDLHKRHEGELKKLHAKMGSHGKDVVKKVEEDKKGAE